MDCIQFYGSVIRPYQNPLPADCDLPTRKERARSRKIRFNYREGKEKYTAEEWIVDKYALNKAKTNWYADLPSGAEKTVDFVDDLCLGAAEALSATTAKAPVEEKKGRKERGESCRQFRSDGNHPEETSYRGT